MKKFKQEIIFVSFFFYDKNSYSNVSSGYTHAHADTHSSSFMLRHVNSTVTSDLPELPVLLPLERQVVHGVFNYSLIRECA